MISSKAGKATRKFVSGLRPFTPGKQCLLWCALGAVACAAPPKWFTPAREVVERLLLPGREALAPKLDAARELVQRMTHFWQAAADANELERRLAELEESNRQLRLRLQAAQPEASGGSSPLAATAVEPLVDETFVEARVLGWQARRYLARRDLIDAGTVDGAQPDALVLASMPEAPALLDAGRDAGLAPHQRVVAQLAGAAIVWGKLADVGPLTSAVRRANDAGYRDLVQLAHPTPDGLRFTARGLLEGHGQRQCRLTRVTLDVPVDVGDLVFAADSLASDAQNSETAAGGRLLYGAVARVERSAAGGHWEIWVEPAIPHDRQPATAAIATPRINPARMANLPSRDSSSSTLQVK